LDAGNEIKFDFDEDGIEVFGSTFSDVTQIIIDKIMNNLLTTVIDPNTFNQVLEITFNSLKDAENAQPYQKAKALFTKMIKENIFIYTDLLQIIGSVNYQQFSKSIGEFTKNIYIVSLFYGNIDSKTIDKININFEKHMDSNRSNKNNNQFQIESLHKEREITGSFIYRTVNDLQSEVNHLIENYYQIGVRDLRRSLSTSIIELCWGNLFYYQLRTMQQLGYIVASTKKYL